MPTDLAASIAIVGAMLCACNGFDYINKAIALSSAGKPTTIALWASALSFACAFACVAILGAAARLGLLK